MLKKFKQLSTKINAAEKTLGDSARKLSDSGKTEHKTSFIIQQDTEVIEEIRDLKDNITVENNHSYKLAYQPVTIKSRNE